MLWKSGHFSRNRIWRTHNRVPRFRNVRLRSGPGLHSRIAVPRTRPNLRISNIASTGNGVEGMSLWWKDSSRAGFIAQSRVSDFQNWPNTVAKALHGSSQCRHAIRVRFTHVSRQSRADKLELPLSTNYVFTQDCWNDRCFAATDADRRFAFTLDDAAAAQADDAVNRSISRRIDCVQFFVIL